MKKRLLGVCMLMVSFQGSSTVVDHIDVFVSRAQHDRVEGCDEHCQIWDVDATDNALAAFFGTLPSNEDEAYHIVMEKINSPAWSAYEQQVVTSQKTVIKAFELGVEKYPAIVFNEQYAVYGITDVSKAREDLMREKE